MVVDASTDSVMVLATPRDADCTETTAGVGPTAQLLPITNAAGSPPTATNHAPLTVTG